jgi:hypothetical protein
VEGPTQDGGPHHSFVSCRLVDLVQAYLREGVSSQLVTLPGLALTVEALRSA